MLDLGLSQFRDYKDWLEAHTAEWDELDTMCRITISRFYRDRGAFEYLRKHVMPVLVSKVISEDRKLTLWSAGCASGEEPYTLSLILNYDTSLYSSDPTYQILATEINPDLVTRGQLGWFRYSSLKDLPELWRNKAFEKKEDQYCIQERYKVDIDWRVFDLRKELPDQRFDLICCRNLVATYFKEELQIRLFKQMQQRLQPGGILMLGIHESLPSALTEFTLIHPQYKMYRKD